MEKTCVLCKVALLLFTTHPRGQKITFKRRISCKEDIDNLELQDAAKLITFVFFLVGEFS